MANNIKTTVEELHKLINVDNVIGEPIETEDKILIPVIQYLTPLVLRPVRVVRPPETVRARDPAVRCCAGSRR